MKTTHLILILFLILVKSGFATSPISISGIITDAQNGKALNDINIVVKEKETGTISNFSGAYLLHLDKGTYDLEFTGKGYEKKEVTVELIKDQEVAIELIKSNKNKKRKTKISILENDILSKK